MNRWTFQLFRLTAGSLIRIILNFASNNKTDKKIKNAKLLNMVSLKHQADFSPENTSVLFYQQYEDSFW